MPATMEQDALAYLQSAGAPATPQNMNRIMMAFMDNPALRPSYNAGSYTADGTFIGADGQGAAVGSYEAGRAAIMRGDAPDAVRERFIRAYGDPGRLTFDMGVPEATTGARAEPIERVELEKMSAGGARSGQPAPTSAPTPATSSRTETVTPTRKPMPVDALSPVMTAADAGGDDNDGIMLPPVVPLAPRTANGPQRAAPSGGPPQLPGPSGAAALPPPSQQSSSGGNNNNVATTNSKVNGTNAGNDIIDAEYSVVDADKSLPKATTNNKALPSPADQRRVTGPQASEALSAPTQRNALPAPPTRSQIDGPSPNARQLPAPDTNMQTANQAALVQQYEAAVKSGDVRAANETLSVLSKQLPPDQVNALRSRVESMRPPMTVQQSEMMGLLEQAIQGKDVRTANQLLTELRPFLSPDQLDAFRMTVEDLDPVGRVMKGLSSVTSRGR